MQKLCCVHTRQHSLPVWIILSQVHHRISTNSQPFLVGIVSHTINTISPSVCQTHDTSVHHAMKMNSPSVCQPNDTSIRHTNIMTSPSVCPSDQLSDCHTTIKTSLSLCQSRIPSVCHNVIPTSPSVCQLQELSVCHPTRDVIIPPVWLTVCSSSDMSVLPSANPIVNMPTSIPVQNFPHEQNPGKIGVFHVASRTMRCAHGSINKILLEWDPGPTYDVQRLWDPGGSTYSSRSSVPTNLDKLGKPKSYLDYIHLPGLSFLPFLLAVKPNLAPSNHLGKLDHMGSFRYLPRLDQQV